ILGPHWVYVLYF
ncbi:hypothetical protein CPC197_0036B, partial [Chlamydia psittaci C1/97]